MMNLNSPVVQLTMAQQGIAISPSRHRDPNYKQPGSYTNTGYTSVRELEMARYNVDAGILKIWRENPWPYPIIPDCCDLSSPGIYNNPSGTIFHYPTIGVIPDAFLNPYKYMVPMYYNQAEVLYRLSQGLKPFGPLPQPQRQPEPAFYYGPTPTLHTDTGSYSLPLPAYPNPAINGVPLDYDYTYPLPQYPQTYQQQGQFQPAPADPKYIPEHQLNYDVGLWETGEYINPTGPSNLPWWGEEKHGYVNIPGGATQQYHEDSSKMYEFIAKRNEEEFAKAAKTTAKDQAELWKRISRSIHQTSDYGIKDPELLEQHLSNTYEGTKIPLKRPPRKGNKHIVSCLGTKIVRRPLITLNMETKEATITPGVKKYWFPPVAKYRKSRREKKVPKTTTPTIVIFKTKEDSDEIEVVRKIPITDQVKFQVERNVKRMRETCMEIYKEQIVDYYRAMHEAEMSNRIHRYNREWFPNDMSLVDFFDNLGPVYAYSLDYNKKYDYNMLVRNQKAVPHHLKIENELSKMEKPKPKTETEEEKRKRESDVLKSYYMTHYGYMPTKPKSDTETDDIEETESDDIETKAESDIDTKTESETDVVTKTESDIETESEKDNDLTAEEMEDYYIHGSPPEDDVDEDLYNHERTVEQPSADSKPPPEPTGTAKHYRSCPPEPGDPDYVPMDQIPQHVLDSVFGDYKPRPEMPFDTGIKALNESYDAIEKEITELAEHLKNNPLSKEVAKKFVDSKAMRQAAFYNNLLLKNKKVVPLPIEDDEEDDKDVEPK